MRCQHRHQSFFRRITINLCPMCTMLYHITVRSDCDAGRISDLATPRHSLSSVSVDEITATLPASPPPAPCRYRCRRWAWTPLSAARADRARAYIPGRCIIVMGRLCRCRFISAAPPVPRPAPRPPTPTPSVSAFCMEAARISPPPPDGGGGAAGEVLAGCLGSAGLS